MNGGCRPVHGPARGRITVAALVVGVLALGLGAGIVLTAHEQRAAGIGLAVYALGAALTFVSAWLMPPDRRE
jgi:hypothetical protein